MSDTPRAVDQVVIRPGGRIDPVLIGSTRAGDRAGACDWLSAHPGWVADRLHPAVVRDGH